MVKITKKLIIAVIAITMMLGTLAIMTGCDNDTNGGNTVRHLNSDSSIETSLELSVRQAFAQNTSRQVSNVWVGVYLGTYNEASVVFMLFAGFDTLPPAVEVEEVAGFEFWTNTGLKISVWNDGKFTSLLSAYDNEILTTENIEKIYELWQESQSN